MKLCRLPKAVLRPFVSQIWTTDEAQHTSPSAQRELVLPTTAAMHIVIRLDGRPLRLFTGPEDPSGHVVGTSVLGGVRTAAYCKDSSAPASMVGVMLRPGVVDPLSHTPASALAERHTLLEDVWAHSDLSELRERLEAAPTPADHLLILEDMLSRRLPIAQGINPLIAQSLLRFDHGVSVGDVVVESGFSHRHLTRTFKTTVGLSPKTYCRLQRFNCALNHLHSVPNVTLTDISTANGYADQAHMTREFRAIAGVAPGHYKRISPASTRHVPIASEQAHSKVKFIQDTVTRRQLD
ncbi:MAG: helix-turn-helix domain-containing protein [Pseudomonadales bacterium]